MVSKTKKKTKTKIRSSKKAKERELSELEKKALEKWKKKYYKERISPPKFRAIEDNSLVNKEENPDKCCPQMLETFGSIDHDFSKTLLSQASSTLSGGEDNVEKVNFIAALMHGLKPQDETEGVLIAQMAGTHNLIMEYMRRAMIPGQYLQAADDYTNRTYKLMNLFLKQIETLEKYRGKTAQQKVIVEHVHIHEGGQAVVGHIESKPRGEGDEHEK